MVLDATSADRVRHPSPRTVGDRPPRTVAARLPRPRGAASVHGCRGPRDPMCTPVQLAPGDPQARLAGPELLVQFSIADGLDRAALDALMSRMSERWAADETIVARVDSIGVRHRGHGVSAAARSTTAHPHRPRRHAAGLGSRGQRSHRGRARARGGRRRPGRHRDRAADSLRLASARSHPFVDRALLERRARRGSRLRRGRAQPRARRRAGHRPRGRAPVEGGGVRDRHGRTARRRHARGGALPVHPPRRQPARAARRPSLRRPW